MVGRASLPPSIGWLALSLASPTVRTSAAQSSQVIASLEADVIGGEKKRKKKARVEPRGTRKENARKKKKEEKIKNVNVSKRLLIVRKSINEPHNGQERQTDARAEGDRAAPYRAAPCFSLALVFRRGFSCRPGFLELALFPVSSCSLPRRHGFRIFPEFVSQLLPPSSGLALLLSRVPTSAVDIRQIFQAAVSRNHPHNRPG